MRTAALALALVLSVSAAAEYRVCRDERSRRAVYTDREPCDEIVQFGYQCSAVTGLPHCNPPARMSYAVSPPPFNQEVTFGGEFLWHGEPYWRWMRGGKVHYVTPKFFLRVPQ